MRWLLLSDLHFKNRDLDRVRRTAQWIVAEAEKRQVGRVVICGDLLTSRTMQPTHVLSVCYRFISNLSDVVPRVHIILGNHDLAYRRDYQTTALEALNIKRLAPHVSLHSVIDRHEWDDRQVLLLPFREEQSELTEAVAAINPDDASKMVAFAHLAINKAILQRFTPHTTNSITYRGLTGPDHFASLARTFTGHFHSHQTITQDHLENNEEDLHGSVTYLGSPLQLNWGDLNDEQRGVVLFDPQTLQHELLINPHAVGYTTVDVQQVLDGQVDQDTIRDKHVMLLGKPNHLNYVTARDSLLSLGVRSVRDWTQTKYLSKSNQRPLDTLGSSVPTSDAAVQPLDEPMITQEDLAMTSDAYSGTTLDAQPEVKTFDLIAEAREYVELLELDESLSSRRDELVRVGQRIIQASRDITDEDSDPEVKYQDFLNRSAQTVGTNASGSVEDSSTDVFVAEPRTLTITNFLGVQNVITINFRHDFPRGLTLLVGDNGSGKSTIVEAIVWCQFGRCIRSGLAVNDVLNDSIGKNCSVTLEFANGYAITRYRKHKVHKNRVVVTLHGESQPHLERPDARTTQAAINELLGTDFDTYIRTVVLSQESAASFLNSTPTQRRELIEASLGLPMLDHWGQMTKLLLKNIDAEVARVRRKLEGVTRTMKESGRRVAELERTHTRLENEAAKAVASLESVSGQQTATKPQSSKERADDTKVTESSVDPRVRISDLQKQIHHAQADLDHLKSFRAEYQTRQRPLEPTGWIDRLQAHVRRTIKGMAAHHPIGLRKLLHYIKYMILKYTSITIASYRSMFGDSEDSCEERDERNQEEVAVDKLDREIEEVSSRLKDLKHEEKRAINHALTISENAARSARVQQAREELQKQVAIKEHDTATYKHLSKTERQSMQRFKSEHDSLMKDLQRIAEDRELFEFWASSLSKRNRNSSSASSAKLKERTGINFREHILLKSITELNVLLAQILTVLYDDTRHANIATGMLHSIFNTDATGATTNESIPASVLNAKLAVNSSLSYGKRSSGERKRVDLALFFALLQLARAKSTHRAHYVLIDEVFDNLDNAGQASVIKWLSVMSQTVVGWVVVITHSQFLIERDVGQDSAKALVVRTSMGQDGTELSANDCKIGRD
ncbi:hypothetical protein FCULG_00008915 [Fusarium culmorum]|uniref:Rad50/SbcC-type AAA domain-containing protein n=1 Tax=Fusarium culmorum TaxID=5516 RepID=A0A2T4H1U3_FUSCU|nr:hypothetical protein FCULG_00008915 [Fusarium culmorum]